MKKIHKITVLILTCLFMILTACTGNESKEKGGITDKTDPGAPKVISSKDITYFSNTFYSDLRWNVHGDHEFYFVIEADENGVLTVYEKRLGLSMPADDELLCALQGVIDEYKLASDNGVYRVTAGLPPEYQAHDLDVRYASGEQLQFTKDNDPYSLWEAELCDIFAAWFSKKGDDSLYPKAEDSKLCGFYLLFRENGKGVYYKNEGTENAEAPDPAKDSVVKFSWGVETEKKQENAGCPQDYFEQLTAMIAATDLIRNYDYSTYDVNEHNLGNHNNGYYGMGDKYPAEGEEDSEHSEIQLHISYESGRRIAIDTKKLSEIKGLRPLIDQMIKYNESLFTQGTDEEDITEEADEEPYDLEEIVIAVDNSFSPGNEKAVESFVSKWEETAAEEHGVDVKLNIKSYSRDKYVGEINALLDNCEPGDGECPDALVMSASMFKAYSDAGYLWDMSKAYDNADFQKRIAQPDVNSDLRTADGRLYGFMPCYGNGCITYVKASWFDIYARNTDGIDSIDDIDDFEKYYDMLKYFSAANVSGVIAAGYLMEEEPYIDMLPEFWQDAYPVFYLDGDKWVDGFSQQATIDALDRIAAAVKDGIIDADTKEADVTAARDKFTSAARSRSELTLNYWAGDWMRTLTDKMSENGVDEELEDERLLMLPPIKEIRESRGGYLRSEAPVWVIVDDGDGNSQREQAVFDALLETMLDGGGVQDLWVKNTKNAHWEYCIAPLENSGKKTDEMVEESKKFFRQYSAEPPLSAPMDLKDADVKKIIKARVDLMNKVIEGKCSGEEAIKEYMEKYGDISDGILKELNKK